MTLFETVLSRMVPPPFEVHHVKSKQTGKPIFVLCIRHPEADTQITCIGRLFSSAQEQEAFMAAHTLDDKNSHPNPFRDLRLEEEFAATMTPKERAK